MFISYLFPEETDRLYLSNTKVVKIKYSWILMNNLVRIGLGLWGNVVPFYNMGTFGFVPKVKIL